jgi:hypothetical protein
MCDDNERENQMRHRNRDFRADQIVSNAQLLSANELRWFQDNIAPGEADTINDDPIDADDLASLTIIDETELCRWALMGDIGMYDD